jgi:energy-coupling factor transporter ATP-binding protein EcfA2
VEEIAEEYALFSRLDITIIDAEQIEADQDHGLDEHLAILLPRVRHAIDNDVTVAAQDVEQFWDRLRTEIRTTAGRMEENFGVSAADVTADLLMELRRPKDDDGAWRDRRVSPPRKVSALGLKGFRSFADDRFALPSVALVYGANGSGKTSICEALEIIWSGQTQRMPDDIGLTEYARHLNRDREGFSLRYALGEDSSGAPKRMVSELEEEPATSLGRTVLAQHVLAEMASSAPKERLGAFLKASGLALPELEKKRIETLRRAAFDEANSALEETGITPMGAVNTNPLQHLGRKLSGSFAAELPAVDQLEGADEALVRVTQGAWKSNLPTADPRLTDLLAAVDTALAPFASRAISAPDPAKEIAEALSALRAEAERLRQSGDPLRLLSQQFSRAMSSAVRSSQQSASVSRAPVPPTTVARWLAHARGLERSVAGLEDLVPTISDPGWRRHLEEYLEALHAAIHRSSADDLEKMTHADEAPLLPPPSSAEPDPDLLKAVGFTRVPQLSLPVLEAMGELHTQLTERAARLDSLAAKLERHPARFFASRAARIMPALFRFQLIRDLTNQRGALARAQEALVTELLDDRLFPVVRELVAALVRFEWYFEALKFRSDKEGLHLTGLATKDKSKDVRFLLNAAERTVVGIAWFLALHILQPKNDRRVLVLDDPASGFDSMNKAAFIATFRSVVRLLKPEQLLITTHDDALLALLEQEFAQLDGWPADSGVLRCRRTAPGPSEVKQLRRTAATTARADLEGELRKLSFEPREFIPVA